MGVWYKYDNFDNNMAKKGAAAPNDSAPGGGGRFRQLKDTLSQEPGVRDPGAVAASTGRKKYGAGKMASFAAKGRKGGC